MSNEWYQRCVPCSQDIPAGKMAEHLRECERAKQEYEVRTPFHGKPNEPITFKPHDVPKV